MPAFTHRSCKYNNPVEFALDKIGGKWKMPILWRLGRKTWRYGEMKRDLPGITHKMLTQHLRELEHEKFLSRKVYAVVPPRVEYTITSRGKETIALIESLRKIGLKWMREEGIALEKPAGS